MLELFHTRDPLLHNFEWARLQVIHAQRKKLFKLWKDREIDDEFLNHLENELDMEEIHIARAELR